MPRGRREAVMQPEPYSNPKYCEEFKCWRCDNSVEVKFSEPMNRVYCDRCWDLYRAEQEALVKEYAKLKIKVMLETALRLMEKSKKIYMHEYLEASREVYLLAITETERFMSAHEIVVAIVLKEFGIEFEANHSVLNYRVDFYIPEFRVCLEVDGHLHRFQLESDSRRDIDIRAALGREWEVIRIPTKYIAENPAKVVDAIERLAKEKRRLRTKNSGIMPDGFSRRENKHYESILRGRK